jgi:hypothetical protein
MRNTYLRGVFAEDFAAKLPTSPQLTVLASHLQDPQHNKRHHEGLDKLSQNKRGEQATPADPEKQKKSPANRAF